MLPVVQYCTDNRIAVNIIYRISRYIAATLFPHVALMAQKYLAIPASSAPSERVYSQLKLIVERKRWRMHGSWMEEGLNKLSFCDATKTSMHNLYY